LKYASGPVSRACSRAGPACLPLPLAGPRRARPLPLPLLAAAARAHRALAGSRWPLGHARRCRALAPCRAGPLPLPRPPACQPARAPRRARPACRCRASCRLLGHTLAAALGRARARACWAAPALALLGCAEPLWAAN